MTMAIETDSQAAAGEPSYEVVFCAPAQALGTGDPQWFIEGCYATFEDARRAARALDESTRGRLHTVSILHARFDAERGAFRERVVWAQDCSIALLSRLNLRPLEIDQRRSIIAHCDGEACGTAERQPVTDEAELESPSPLLVVFASMLAASACAAGVLLLLT